MTPIARREIILQMSAVVPANSAIGLQMNGWYGFKGTLPLYSWHFVCGACYAESASCRPHRRNRSQRAPRTSGRHRQRRHHRATDPR
ncbi:hypothetical protein F0170_06750 [Pseudomonas sp. MAFF 730085]|uniref:Uncharacterized protein n=1 Tax=Pseudomonas kitaguniensis TaxID=2607908 RepID=A0A5N7JQV3_9PSED|nr:hypothetical protein [Pseudomonas kitaguniensis]